MGLPFLSALLTAKDIYAADQAAAQRGTTPFALMERAGQSLTHALLQRYPRSKVLVICGPGNNGGDGFVVARLLAERGWQVTVSTENGSAPSKGPAAKQAQRWTKPLVAFESLTTAVLQQYDLLIDAGFGVGLSRPLTAAWQDCIIRLRESQRPIIAIDLPTGLADDGRCWVEPPVQAQLTLTLFRKKLAHVLAPGRHYCGEVLVCDLGLDASYLPQPPVFYENGPGLWSLYWQQTRPQATTHKYQRGHVLVFGGPQLPGAACLAALAAARSGAGMVTLLTDKQTWPVYAAQMRAIMVRCLEPAHGLEPWLADPKNNTWVLGPGAISVAELSTYIKQLLAAKKPCVLDAEALSVMASQWPEFQSELGPHCVLTPHEGEFWRLFPHLAQDTIQTRLQRVQQAARESQATIVLKGAETLIAAPDGRVIINHVASPYLATAGSGDVLSGIIATFLAQDVPALIAAAMAVWLHGRAGEIAGVGLMADDLPQALVAAQQMLDEQLSST